MTAADPAAWQENNDAYLAAVVEWLRLLLAHHASAGEPPIAAAEYRGSPRPTAASQSASPPWWAFRRATPSSPPSLPKAPLALPPATLEVTEEQVAEAERKVRSAAEADPVPALELLARRLVLSPFERDMLLLCIALELDTRIAALCARVHDDPARAYPTYALGFTIFDQPGWDALSPDRPLRYWRLIEINQPGAQPLTTSAMRADERIVNYAKGVGHLDDRVAPFVLPFGDPVSEDVPPSHRAVVDEIINALHADQPHFRPLQLLGRDSDSKQLVANAVAQRLGLILYRASGEMLPQQAADLETLTRLWQRETILLPVGLYVEARDIDRASETHATPLKRFLARSSGVVFVDARDAWPVPRGSHSFDVGKPAPTEQRELWTAVLGEDERKQASLLAAQFNLSVDAIHRIAADARDESGEAPMTDRVWRRAAQNTRMNIDALAQRIEPKAKWDDIVLPPAETSLLKQITAHVAGRGTVYDDWGFRDKMNRGFGISALFAGASGTGKTMAAEVIANELGQGLHRIDLSSVVSKWVGETEKNLERLFQAAEDSNGILFFDEADALFGKRLEAQHSQDRFANIEINYLLQRLETYPGLAILATNMKDALDPAFVRRLRFIIQFPFPGPAERLKIWKLVFPDQTPREDLDLERLAKINITGGSIHSIALNAAFLAASSSTPVVTMEIVLEATRGELRKLEKPVNEADFILREKERRTA
jgi:hypothetical protein